DVIGLDHPNITDAVLPKGGERLIDEIQSRDAEYDVAALLSSHSHYMRSKQRFSEPGRCLKHRAPVPEGQRGPQKFDRPLLVDSKNTGVNGRGQETAAHCSPRSTAWTLCSRPREASMCSIACAI